MKTFLSLCCAICAALVIAGCGPTIEPPDIKQNPHPKVRYDVTMTIDGSPGPFDSIEGYVMYQVLDGGCSPLRPGSGAGLMLEESMPLLFTYEAGVYKATLYLDQLQDEDYFGLGVCHWVATFAGAKLRIRNAVLSPAVHLDDPSHQESTTYFSTASYHDNELSGGSSGQPMTEYVAKNPGKFFSIRLTANGVHQ